MKPWHAVVGIVIVTIAVWKLWTLVVAYKWPIVIAILVFGIGLVAWQTSRGGRRGDPR